MKGPSVKRSRGAALLLAMLVVALVASLAAAVTWEQRKSVQQETDERAHMQSNWLIRGALDWAKIVLVLDAEADSKGSSSTDHYSEPWAVPLAESKLSAFLAAENNVAQNANVDLGEAFFSGAIVDLDARLNIANLLVNASIDPAAVAQFQRLFASLGLAPDLVPALATRYLEATRNELDAQVSLAPRCIDELVWLGLSVAQVETLRPYVTVLPERVKVNLNTASEPVLAAALSEETAGAAARLVALRTQQPFSSVQSAQDRLNLETAFPPAPFSVSSEFFLVSGHIRLDDLELQDRYVVQRNGRQLRTVRRECSDPSGRMEVAKALEP